MMTFHLHLQVIKDEVNTTSILVVLITRNRVVHYTFS